MRPDEAAPISASAEALFRGLTAGGGTVAFRPEELAEHDAELDELQQIGLIAYANRGTAEASLPTVVAADPHRAADRWQALLEDKALALLDRAERESAAMDGLLGTFLELPRDKKSAPNRVEILHGPAAINARIGRIVAGCTKEVLTVHSTLRNPDYLREALPYDMEVARRLRFRVVYLDGERERPEILQPYVVPLLDLGAEFRTLPATGFRLFLFDGETAVVDAAAAPSKFAACVITDPPVVAYIHSSFQSLWERARVLDPRAADPQTAAALPGVQPQIIKLLHAGLSQDQIAKRLNLTSRTMASHIAQLKALYNVQTLFQLGIATTQ